MDPNIVILAGGVSSRMRNSIAQENISPELMKDAAHKPKAMIGLGERKRPFLDYLLYNIREAGYRDVVIVIGEHDASVKEYYGEEERNNSFHGLTISYAVQHIPPGRTKPLGTAAALLRALEEKKDWQGQQFTVCNSDNLYSHNALKILFESPYLNAMIEYDRDALRFPPEKVQQFAVIKKDVEGFLLDIIEKPSAVEIDNMKSNNGTVGVSMNIFRLEYDRIISFLNDVPLHPVRNEKELPLAVRMMVQRYPKSVFAHPLAERVVDLTNKEDISSVKKYLEEEFPDFSF